jgi:predicted permease
MRWRKLTSSISFLRAWLRRSRVERDMDREMQFHVAARADDLESRGMSRADAERQAQREFGDVVRWKEAGREVRGLLIVDDLAADLRYAWRTMRRTPGFTTAAIASLALGIGATTAIFGLLDLLLLRSLPVHAPHELVHVTTAGERSDGQSGSSNVPWYREVTARRDLFADTMLVRLDVHKVVINRSLEPLIGQRVTTNYHNLLGIRPVLGRMLSAEDRPEIGAPPVAVISHALWQTRFNASPDVVGESITVDRQPYTIVGVTPPGFRGTLIGWNTDVTMPLDTREFMQPGNWLTMPLIARLQPGVTAEAVQQQLDPLLTGFVDAHGTTERFRARYLRRVSVTSAATGLTDLRERFSTPLWILMGAVGLLLLIACVNLAGLLLARNATRQHELGMRLALGARPARLVRQLLTESAALALVGASLGVILAINGGNMLVALLPPYFGPVSMRLAIDGRVLAFSLFAAVTATLICGLMPAWQASRFAALPAMNRHDTRTTTRPRIGRLLVVAQFALSVVLIGGALLCVRTIVNLAGVDTGFNRDRLLVVRMDPQGTEYEREHLRAFQREMLATLGALPGVRQVTLSTSSPFNGNIDGRRLSVPGVQPRDPEDEVIQVNLIGPGYFDALQIPVLHGRPVDQRDREATQRVAVVSESFARRYFADTAAAIGRTMVVNRGPKPIPHEIVGVAADTRYQNLRRPSERLAYLSWFQADDLRLAPFEFVLRTEADPSSWTEVVRSAIRQRHPGAPILTIDTMNGVINGQLLTERLLAMLGTFFAVVALTLAAVGIYGLLAHLVARRTREIGVRLALGARPGEMMWMTVRESLALVVSGAAIGIVAAAAGLRALEGVLFGLAPTDTVTLLLAAVVLILVALAAAFVPARRAATVDPLIALRAE